MENNKIRSFFFNFLPVQDKDNVKKKKRELRQTCLEVGIFKYLVSSQDCCGLLSCVVCVTMSRKVKYAKYAKALSLVPGSSAKYLQADGTGKYFMYY